MAKRKEIEWQYVVEDGGKMSQEDFDLLVSLLAEIIIAQLKRKAETKETTSPLDKESA